MSRCNFDGWLDMIGVVHDVRQKLLESSMFCGVGEQIKSGTRFLRHRVK